MADRRVALIPGRGYDTWYALPGRGARLPAVWLTSLLHRPEVVDALDRATAPFLPVGGTADSSWNGPLAQRLTPYVVEITDADHSLIVPGPLARSAEALGRVCTALEDFLAGRALAH
ncbi:alpha/beta hydrolase [Micromonospora sp. NPDC047707]|uniref:alpha/beta hydrolase n=1 Tax=Micromonospora sp. NPDC047707 TaxID=3154498 RepID=UPI0034533AC2